MTILVTIPPEQARWHLQDCEARLRLASAGLADAKRSRDTAWIALQQREIRNARTALARALKRVSETR